MKTAFLLLIASAAVVLAEDSQCNFGCTPIYNTFLGDSALPSQLGYYNTAIGGYALNALTTGYNNTAIGAYSLMRVNLNDNTAVGFAALQENLSQFNTAIGSLSLFQNQTGIGNTATGANAMTLNISGNYNSAVGWTALETNRTGDYNTALGFNALNKSDGSFNTAIGANAGVMVMSATDVTCIGANVTGQNISHTTWIGNVHGKSAGESAIPVVVNASGRLGTDGSIPDRISKLERRLANLEAKLRRK